MGILMSEKRWVTAVGILACFLAPILYVLLGEESYGQWIEWLKSVFEGSAK